MTHILLPNVVIAHNFSHQCIINVKSFRMSSLYLRLLHSKFCQSNNDYPSTFINCMRLHVITKSIFTTLYLVSRSQTLARRGLPTRDYHILHDDNVRNDCTHFYFSELQLLLLANNPRTDQVISLQSPSTLVPRGPSNVCPVKL